MKTSVGISLIISVLIATAVIFVDDIVITRQKKLIEQMSANPNCMVDQPKPSVKISDN